MDFGEIFPFQNRILESERAICEEEERDAVETLRWENYLCTGKSRMEGKEEG